MSWERSQEILTFFTDKYREEMKIYKIKMGAVEEKDLYIKITKTIEIPSPRCTVELLW